MSPPFAANWNERVLIQVSCMRRQGPLAYNGLLTLTDIRLSFVPTGRLDRMVGVRELEIPITMIESAEVKGIDKTMIVNFGQENARFIGKGALRVFARLDALLHEAQGSTPPNESFEPGERVLVQGAATSYANGLIATRGELLLSDKRLRFLAGTGLETRIWDFPEINHPLEAISRAEMSGVRKLLEIWIEGERLVFGGPVVPKLFNSLQALGIQSGSEGEVFRAPEGAFHAYPASAYRGLLASPGELMFSDRNVSFTPSGRLDSLVGAKATSLALVDIVHLEVLENRKLIFVGHEENLALDVANPMARLKELLPLITNALAAQLDNLQDDAPDGFDELLQAWTPKLKLKMGEPIVLTGPAVHWVRPAAGTRGWLALTDSRLLFLPAAGPKGNSPPVLVELSELNRGDSLNDEDIFVEHGEGVLHFQPLTGMGFVDAFWMLSEPIITEEIEQEEVQRRIANAPKEPPIQGVPDAEARSDDHTLNRVLGSLLSLSIQRDKQTILLMRPAFTIATKEGLGIVLTEAPGLRFRRGELIDVDFAQPEGTYQFDTLVHRMAPVPAAMQQSYPDALGLLVVEMPNDLRFHNRRNNYRIKPNINSPCTVLFLEEIPGLNIDQVKGEVVNISMGGCQLQTREFIPEDAKLIIKVELEDGEIEVQGVCTRADPPEDIKGQWLFGLRFVHMSDRVTGRINQEIVRRQREELAKTALEEED